MIIAQQTVSQTTRFAVLTIQKTLSVFSTVAAVLLANLGLAQVDPRWKPNDPLRPTPAVITPGAASTQDSSGRPPSDAVVLFDRKDLSPWVGEDGQAAKWKLSDGYLEVLPHSGYIHTRQPFGDCQLHVEFAEPVPAVGEGQDRGKSTTASKWQAPPDAGVLSLVNQGIEPRHYVFPACENCHVDPTTPQKSWRSARRTLRKETGLADFRFHDLRHHAITELAESGASDQTIMSIAGHVSREMLEHYSHIRLEAKRRAVEVLSQKGRSRSNVTNHVTKGANRNNEETASPRKDWSGREDLNLRPLVPNYRSQNSKCFIWCRLGTNTPSFLSLSCTEVVPKTFR